MKPSFVAVTVTVLGCSMLLKTSTAASQAQPKVAPATTTPEIDAAAVASHLKNKKNIPADEIKAIIRSKTHSVEEMTVDTGCYDQSKYFCGSTTCLGSSNSMDSSGCGSYFSGFGAPCPQNATCTNGKYRCDYGFEDTFNLDHYISDSSDCTACNIPKGCVRDPTVPFLPEASANEFTYSYSSYAAYYFGNMCGKRVTINGCEGYNYWGDQYFSLYDTYGNYLAASDDAFGRLCSYIDYQFPSDGSGCSNPYVVLRCYNWGTTCGGTVTFEITGGGSDAIAECPQGEYYHATADNTTDPCLTCPQGTSNLGAGNLRCDDCDGNYMGFGGSAPCVPCPMGTVANNVSDACIPCNAQSLQQMHDDHVYERCLQQLLEKANTLEQRVDDIILTFEAYLTDIKYQQPTVIPTMRPTRRRRSKSPTMEA